MFILESLQRAYNADADLRKQRDFSELLEALQASPAGSVFPQGFFPWLFIHGKKRYITLLHAAGVHTNIFSIRDRSNYDLSFDFLATVELTEERRDILRRLFLTVPSEDRVRMDEVITDLLSQVDEANNNNFIYGWLDFFLLGLDPMVLHNCEVPHLLTLLMDPRCFHTLKELHARKQIETTAYVSSIGVLGAMFLLSGDQATAQRLWSSCDSARRGLHVFTFRWLSGSAVHQPDDFKCLFALGTLRSAHEQILTAVNLVNISTAHLSILSNKLPNVIQTLVTNAIETSEERVASGADLLRILHAILNWHVRVTHCSREVARFAEVISAKLSRNDVIAQSLQADVLSIIRLIGANQFGLPATCEIIGYLCDLVDLNRLSRLRMPSGQGSEIVELVLSLLAWCRALNLTTGPRFERFVDTVTATFAWADPSQLSVQKWQEFVSSLSPSLEPTHGSIESRESTHGSMESGGRIPSLRSLAGQAMKKAIRDGEIVLSSREASARIPFAKALVQMSIVDYVDCIDREP